MKTRGPLLAVIFALAASFAACHFSQPAWAGAASLAQQLGLRSGAQIYQRACAACHGSDGHGTPQATAGFTPPETFPHFDKCDETTPEFTEDYTAVIRNGGPARGFSPIMPSFGAVLTADEINWGDRELSADRVTDWDLLPEFQVTLNRRQHIRAALGYRVPINDTAGRPKQVVAYFLWDWFDGGLLEGW